MSLVNGSVDGLLDGVSQEPPVLRLPSHATEQINGWSSRAFGLLKRPPTALVKKMVAATPPSAYGNALVHTIRRAPNDIHKVIVKNGDIEIYDALTGNVSSVSSKTDTSYLSTGNPNQDIRCLTLGDTTFILNRNANTLRNTTRSIGILNHQALIFIKSVDYSTTYAIELANIGGGGFTSFDPNEQLFHAPGFVSYTTPAGDTAAARAQISTDFVAQSLFNKLKAGTFPNTGALFTTIYSFNLINSTIIVTRNLDNYDFGIAVTDGLADTAIGCIKHSVTSAADLPQAAPDGYLVQIQGDPTSAFDNYWVAYNSQDTAQGQGVWKEVVAPDVEIGFDNTTMPHIITETPVRSYYFKDGGVAPVVNVTDCYDTGHVQQWDTLTANQNLVLTAQDSTGTAIFPAASGLQNKDALVTCTFDLDTTGMASGDSVSITLEKETAPASGIYTVVATRIFLPGAKFLNETIAGLIRMQNSTTYHARLKMHYNNSGGGTATLTGHSANQDGSPGFFYKIIIGTVLSTKYDVWPVSVGTDVNSPITLSFDVAGTGNIYLAIWYQIDDTKADLALNALVNGGALLPDGGLVEESNEVGGFNIVASLITGSDAPNANRAWLIQWQSQNAHDGVPVITATRTLANSATGVGTGKVTIFDPNFTGIATGYASTSIKNTRTGEVLTADAQNLRSFHIPAGYTNPLAQGDIYKVTTIASFTFGPATWTQRKAGDNTTNPFPSFEKHSIMDLFQTGGRLGFVSDNNVIMSASNDVFNFFKQTATQLFADDLIDIKAASQKPAFFHSAVEWDNRLYLVSDLQIFECGAGTGQLLTPSSVSLKMVLDMESERIIRPFSSGRRLFIARTRTLIGQFSEIVELSHQPSGDGLVFTNVTKHIPNYLQGQPLKMSGDDGSGALFLLTTGYGFYPNFYGSTSERPFNSWSTWDFDPGQVLDAEMFNGVLTIVMLRADGVYLETMDLTTAPGLGVVHQDIGTAPYTFVYILTTVYPRRILRDYTLKVDRLANLQMRYLNMRFEQTQSFAISVVNPLRQTYSSVYSSATPKDGLFLFAVMGKNTDIVVTVTDTSQFPLRFSGFDWEATYSVRSQRL